MTRGRVRAVVLAAGLGTRLRPLTEAIPKPLLPVVGRPLAAHTLERLREWGCEAAAINLHHLGDRVRDALGESFGDLSLTYSTERRILGTLGALGQLRDFLRGADEILVVNGDSLCRWPIDALVRRHRESPALATLLFSGVAPPAEYGGGVRIGADDLVRSFRHDAPTPGGEDRQRVFAGAHVLSPRLLDRVPEGRSDFIADLYEPMLEEGEEIAALESEVAWHDLGTPARYLAAALSWIPHGSADGRTDDSWVSPRASIGDGASIARSVVEGATAGEGSGPLQGPARVGAGARVEESVILPGAEVGAGCRLSGCIVGPGVRLEDGSALRGRMATAPAAGGDRPPGIHLTRID
jgi:NDP-sugar pyrophosphorylase family protein